MKTKELSLSHWAALRSNYARSKHHCSDLDQGEG